MDEMDEALAPYALRYAELTLGAPCTNSAPESDCEYWSTMGECTRNEAFMKTGCARSCGFCTVKEQPVELEDDDEFKDEL